VKVVIIGAGIGGLALAQALHRAGDEVRIYDRDADISATGGYRLHLDDRACAALRRHLSPGHYQALLASSAGPAAFRRFSITDHRLRPLVIEHQDPDAERLLIGRIPLRRLLAYGLGDVVRVGAEFTGYSTDDGAGTVTAHFADGTTAEADLLVGADGVGSRVARALAGQPTSARVGVSGIAGRTLLAGPGRPVVPELLRAGPALAFGPGGIGIFLSLHDLGAGAAADPATCVDVPPDREPPLLIWGLLALDQRFPAGLRDRGPDALAPVAVELLAGWSPVLRSLVRAAEPGGTAFFGFNAVDPAADLTPWPAGRVTALGDAVHAMPPTAGQGAATAIRDADLLAACLASVRSGESTLAGALGEFHRGMAAYAPAAVRESLGPVRWMRITASPGAALVTRAALPVAATVAAGIRALRGDRGTAPAR
jgi:salicylate hydroxylase